MAIDPIYNLKFTTVASVSGNDITVDDPSMLRDDVSAFIDNDFLVWAAGETPTPTNSEYVRPTADVSGTFTISRQQQGSSLRTITVGDYIALAPTKLTFDQLQAQIDSKLEASDIASGTITARADDINLSGGSDGDVLTVQADGSLALETPSGGGGGSSTPKYRFGSIFEGSVNAGANYQTRFYEGNTGNGGTVAWGSGVTINTNTNSNGYAGVRASGPSNSTFSLFGGNYSFTCVHQLGYSTPNGTWLNNHGVGFALMTNGSGFTATGKHVGWLNKYQSGTYTNSYSVADGTTQSSSTYTPDTSAFTNMLYFAVTGTSSAAFYKNGTLLGTITTNIPTGNEAVVSFSTSNSGSNTVSQAPTYNMFEYAKEMF